MFQFRLHPQTGFLFPMVSETSLAPKMSVAAAQGIRTPVDTHDGHAMQLLHVWPQVFAISREPPLPHALHTYRLAMAAVRFPIT